MSAYLGHYDLETVIANEPAEFGSGRTSSLLLKTPDLRVLVISLTAGTEIREHSAPGPITIQTIRGRLAVVVGEEEAEVGPLGLLAIDTDIRHSVRALEASSFLLTISWPGDHEDSSAQADLPHLHG